MLPPPPQVAIFAHVQPLSRSDPEASHNGVRKQPISITRSDANQLVIADLRASPPVVDTGWITDEVCQAVDENTLLIHIAQPGDVAGVIAYLVSDHANLTNANIVHLR